MSKVRLMDSSRGLSRKICEIFAKYLQKIREKFAKNSQKIREKLTFVNFSGFFHEFFANISIAIEMQ